MKPGTSEIEELSLFFRGWRLEFIQLGPWRDASFVSVASFRSHRILRFQAANSFVMRGDVRKACLCVGTSGPEQAAVRCLGQPLHANDLLLAGADATIDLLVPGGAVGYFLIVDSTKFLSRRALRLCEGMSSIDGNELNQYIRHPGRHDTGTATRLVDQFCEEVSASGDALLDRVARSVRLSAVVTACRLVDDLLPAPITVRELSRRCGVAERTLDYGFRDVYSTTPLTFVKSQRLTRSRMALLRAGARASISQIARTHGFTHMGQYSRDYHRLFGETPSMTRGRGRPLPAAKAAGSEFGDT